MSTIENDPDDGLRGATAAMIRAAARAGELARLHGTPLVIAVEGRTVWLKIEPDGTEIPYTSAEEFAAHPQRP